MNQPLQGVRYEKTNGIATITIDRSERGNSLAPAMQAMFRAIWSDVRDNPDVRVAVITAAGERHFVVNADIVIASCNAKFIDSHVNIGMVGAIENIGLAKRLPLGTALRMTLMGSSYRLSSERAHQLGLVDELVKTPDAARALAQEMAAQLLKNSPQAMALSKRAIWGALEQGYEQALENGWSLLRSHWTHPDFEEGPKAFAEKRAPVWNPDPNAKT